jgi:hypothetical protein
MLDLLKQFEKRSPEYDNIYYEPIVFRFTVVGGDRGREDEKQARGKYFSNVYELYIYTALLGITKDRCVPLMEGITRRNFIKIDEWRQHPELVKFLEMALLTKSDIDFNALEDMTEDAIDAELTKLKKLLEGYANGGFEILANILQNNPSYFSDEYCFVNLLSDVNGL